MGSLGGRSAAIAGIELFIHHPHGLVFIRATALLNAIEDLRTSQGASWQTTGLAYPPLSGLLAGQPLLTSPSNQTWISRSGSVLMRYWLV